MIQRIREQARVKPMRALLVISAFMLVISFARLAKDPPQVMNDQTENWWPVVNSVLDGEGYVSCLPEYFPFCGEGNNATAMREPVPVMVHAGAALVSGRSLWAAAALQILMNMLVAWMLFAIGRRLIDPMAGLLAAALWALYLPAYGDLIQIGGDQVATIAVLGAVLVLARSWGKATLRDHFFIGALIGLAALSRSALMVFIAAAALVPLIAWLRNAGERSGHMKGLATMVGAFILVLSPWAVRNQLVFDRPIIGSTLSGYNLFRHNSFLDQGAAPHYVASEEGGRALQALLKRHPELKGDENEAQMDAVYKAEGKAIIARNPIRYAGACAFRALPLFVDWRVNAEYGKPSGALDLVMAVQQLILLALAVFGFRKAGSWRIPLIVGLILFCLLHMAVVCRMRYLLPVMPVVVLFASVGLSRLAGRSNA